jgi:uncharacterized protein DUF1707
VTEPHDDLRASDADREAVATQLRAAGADGRLDPDELEERLGQAYAAKTFGDLAPLTADLAPPPAPVPASTPESAPNPLPPPPPPGAPARRSGPPKQQIRAWAGTSVLLVGVWAIVSLVSGELLFFWPIFPIGFWGIAIIAQLISGNSDDNRS